MLRVSGSRPSENLDLLGLKGSDLLVLDHKVRLSKHLARIYWDQTYQSVQNVSEGHQQLRQNLLNETLRGQRPSELKTSGLGPSGSKMFRSTGFRSSGQRCLKTQNS